MKKFFVFSIIFFSLCAKVSAQDLFAPSWSEFCPSSYVNAEHMDYSKRPAWQNVLLIASFVGIFYEVNKSMLISANNYWVDRRVSFENEIKECNQLSKAGERTSCYMQVRMLEQEKNHQMEEEQIARQQLSVEYQNLNELRRLNNNLIYH